MNASHTLNKIELRFWYIATPLMQQSPPVRWLVRAAYRLYQGDLKRQCLPACLQLAAGIFAIGVAAGLLFG